MAQLGPQTGQRPPHQVGGQVRHQTDAVRQLGAAGEGRAPLVVHEEEGDAVRGQGLGHPQHPGLEELRLSGARRPPDQGVRPVGAQVQRQGRLRPLPHQGTQAQRLLEGDDRPTSVDDRVVGTPPGDLGIHGVRQLLTGQTDEGDRRRKVGLVVDGHPGVDHRCQVASQCPGLGVAERLGDDIGSIA